MIIFVKRAKLHIYICINCKLKHTHTHIHGSEYVYVSGMKFQLSLTLIELH